MTSYFRKTIIKLPFEILMNQLTDGLDKEGFVVAGVTDYQDAFGKKLNIHFKKYKVFAVHIPHLYREMLMLATFPGMVLPCSITMVEIHPGEVELVPVNPTEIIVHGIHNPSLQNIAEEVSRRLGQVIESLEREPSGFPDLVTSWD